MYPVGSVYLSVVATDPATLFGFGTWARIGKGRALVGVDEADSDFDTPEETGGEKTHTLTTPELAAHGHGVTDGGHVHTQNAHGHGVTDAGHVHTQNAHGHGVTDGGHNHTQNPHAHGEQYRNTTTAGAVGLQGAATANNASVGTTDNATAVNQSATTGLTVNNATATDQSATTGVAVQNAGGGGAHNNLQPYLTLYVWKRTA